MKDGVMPQKFMRDGLIMDHIIYDEVVS